MVYWQFLTGKTTPLQVLSALYIIIGLLWSVWGWWQGGMAALSAAILLSRVGLAVLVFFADRLMVGFLPQRTVIALQIVLLLVLVYRAKSKNRVLKLWTDSSISYFSVVTGDCTRLDPELEGTFGFDKVLNLENSGQTIYLSNQLRSKYDLNLEQLEWGNHLMTGIMDTINEKIFSLEIYYRVDAISAAKEAQIFQQMRQALRSRTDECAE